MKRSVWVARSPVPGVLRRLGENCSRRLHFVGRQFLVDLFQPGPFVLGRQFGRGLVLVLGGLVDHPLVVDLVEPGPRVLRRGLLGKWTLVHQPVVLGRLPPVPFVGLGRDRRVVVGTDPAVGLPFFPRVGCVEIVVSPGVLHRQRWVVVDQLIVVDPPIVPGVVLDEGVLRRLVGLELEVFELVVISRELVVGVVVPRPAVGRRLIDEAGVGVAIILPLRRLVGRFLIPVPAVVDPRRGGEVRDRRGLLR